MSDVPPANLKVLLKEDVKNAHGSVEGIYTLSKYPVNGKNCWLDEKKETLLFYDLNFNQSWTFAKNNDSFSALGQVKDKVIRFISSTPDPTFKNETKFPTKINNWSWYDKMEGKWLQKAEVQISEIIEPTIEDLKTEIKKLRGENQELKTKLASNDQLMTEIMEVKEENRVLKQQMEQILEKMENNLPIQLKHSPSISEESKCNVIPSVMTKSSASLENLPNDSNAVHDTIAVVHAMDTRNDIKVNFWKGNNIFFRFENDFYPDLTNTPGYRLNLALKSLDSSIEDPIQRFKISKIRPFKKR